MIKWEVPGGFPKYYSKTNTFLAELRDAIHPHAYILLFQLEPFESNTDERLEFSTTLAPLFSDLIDIQNSDKFSVCLTVKLFLFSNLLHSVVTEL